MKKSSHGEKIIKLSEFEEITENFATQRNQRKLRAAFRLTMRDFPFVLSAAFSAAFRFSLRFFSAGRKNSPLAVSLTRSLTSCDFDGRMREGVTRMQESKKN